MGLGAVINGLRATIDLSLLRRDKRTFRNLSLREWLSGCSYFRIDVKGNLVRALRHHMVCVRYQRLMTSENIVLYKAPRELRTMQDAIHALQIVSPVPLAWPAKIKIGAARLPTGEVTNIVLVVARASSKGQSSAIGFPFFSDCRVRFAGSDFRLRMKAEVLDEAAVNQDGSVDLVDGKRVNNIVINPTLIHHELTDREKVVLKLAFEMMRLKLGCYSVLRSLVRPKLSACKAYIDECRRADPTIPSISQETIRTALNKCGMHAKRLAHKGR